MTALLAIDTSGLSSGVAVAVDGKIRSEITEVSTHRPSESLFRMIDSALEGADVPRAGVRCVAVTTGPGSFTGLRVGVATAKGIAFALKTPVTGVSTLEALARGALPFPGLVVPLLDARKRQVYGAAYRGETGEPVISPAAWEPREMAQLLSRETGPCLLLGSGLAPHGDAFLKALPGRAFVTGPGRWRIRPGAVAAIGWEDYVAGRFVDPAHLVPTYCRLSEAEEARRSSEPA